MDIRDLEKALEPADGTLTLDGSKLKGAGIDELLKLYNGNQPIRIAGASPPGDQDPIRVSGTASFANMPDLPAEAVFTIDETGTPQARIAFTLIGETAKADAWRFSKSFPDMPERHDLLAAPGAAPVPFLDDLKLTETELVLSTRADDYAERKVPLARGLNFVSKVQPSGVLAALEGAFGGTAAATLAGTITMPRPAHSTPRLPHETFPWQLDAPAPGILLQAKLDLSADLEKLKLDNACLRVYTPLTEAWRAKNPSFAPAMALTGTLHVPSADASADLTALVHPGLPFFELVGAFEGVTIGKLEALADLSSGAGLESHLPDPVRSLLHELDSLSLEAAAVGISASFDANALAYVSATVGFPHKTWPLLGKEVVLGGLSAEFMIVQPFGAGRQISTTVRGDLSGFGVELAAATRLPDFAVSAALEAPAEIPLADFFRAHFPGLPAPPDLSIDGLYVFAQPGKSYSLSARMMDDKPWTLDLGPGDLTISDVSLDVTKPAEGAASGQFEGTIEFDEAMALSMRYEIPGDFLISAAFPKVDLSRIVARLTNQAVSLPEGFDLTFEDASVLIEEAHGDLTFLVGARYREVGSFAFEARKVDKGQKLWGFAAGLDLSSGAASSLPALGPLKLFEDMFDLRKLVLVVSSFADPGFAFPDLAQFNNPQISAGGLKLPGQGGVVAGLNLFGEWLIDTSDKKQNLLATLLGTDPQLDMTLQVGKNPSQDARLFVAFKTKIEGHPLAGDFGAQMKNGEPGLFLEGKTTVSIQGQDRTFDVALLFVLNGAFISATMKSSTPVEIKFEGVKVFDIGDLAIVVGVDWEGVPSLGVAGTVVTDRFEASIAVFFDSAEPARSMIAGSLSDASLKDVVDTLTGGAVPSEIDGILDHISLKGTHSFKLDASLADDLDHLNIAAVAKAFAAQKVTIPSTLDQVFLVVEDPGKQWYLTDLADKARHYEIKAADGGLVVSLEAQLYCVPERTTIGALPPYDPGLFLNGSIDVFGFDAEVTVDVEPTKGIAVDGQLDRLVIGTEALFSLEAAKGDGGPSLSLATFAQPKQSPEKQKPHFLINGQVKILGLAHDVFASVSSKGIAFDLNGDLSPAAHFDVHGTAGGTHALDVGGSVTVGLGDIDLGPLGHVDIGTGVDGKLDIKVTKSATTATLGGGFEFASKHFDLKVPVKLDVNSDDLTRLPELLLDKVKDLLTKFLTDPKQWLNMVKNGLIKAVEDPAGALKSVYHLEGNVAAVLLKGIGQTADQIGDALKNKFGVAGQAAAGILHGLGFAANEIGGVLKDTYGLAGDAAAGILKGLGFPAGQIGGVLKDTFKMPANAVAGALKSVGFPIGDIGGVLKDGFGLPADGAAKVLKGAGFAANQVGKVLEDHFGLAGEAAGKVLEGVGYAADQIGKTFKKVIKIFNPGNWW